MSENTRDETHACEGAPELNGKDASFRTVNMISAPATVVKRRIRGALVPMPKQK